MAAWATSTSRSSSGIFDVAVIGGGVVGAATASATARRGLSVVLCESEPQFGIHASGRSATSLDPLIESEPLWQLTSESLRHLRDICVLNQRPLLLVASTDSGATELLALAAGARCTVELLTAAQAAQCCAALRVGCAQSALWVREAFDIDAGGLLRALLSDARAAGAETRTSAAVRSLRRRRGLWELNDGLRASIVVNTAGAWADDVAALADVEPLGLRPLKRSAFTVAAPSGAANWPLVADVPETFYLKPWQTGELLISAAEETPDTAGDACFDDLQGRRSAAAVRAITDLVVSPVLRSWAGHRTFAEDRLPVIGPDPDTDTFIWCTAMGGMGVQTAPAAGRLTADLIIGNDLDSASAALAAALSPNRFRGQSRGSVTAPDDSG